LRARSGRGGIKAKFAGILWKSLKRNADFQKVLLSFCYRWRFSCCVPGLGIGLHRRKILIFEGEAMKVIAVSDTHLPEREVELPSELVEALNTADMVLHAGDFTSQSALEFFQQFRNFVAVHGNMDSPPVRRALKKFEVVEVEGVRIGLVHGWGAPDPLPGTLLSTYKGEDLRAIVFGHTHRALNEEVEGVLLFNPGSPTDTVFAPYCSYGVLTIENGKIEAKVVRL